MTKDSVIKVRTDFSGSPVKITCDNMIIIWDKIDSNSTVLWDDEKERLIVIRPNTERFQDSFPVEILITEYEHIQFMEAYLSPKDAIKWIEANKASFDTALYEDAINTFKTSVGCRGYTGTIPASHRDNIVVK